MQLRTLFRNGTPLSPLFSVASALFLSRRGWYPPCRSQPREPVTSLWMGRRYSQALCFHQPAASYSLLPLFFAPVPFVFSSLQPLLPEQGGGVYAEAPPVGATTYRCAGPGGARPKLAKHVQAAKAPRDASLPILRATHDPAHRDGPLVRALLPPPACPYVEANASLT
ncbi:MAG: hypothetical protein JWO71_575 [Candidatus Acidoferrum typicum]|nr:hypothetical protein [Candidatus Acidoferrum typicum]